jgi:hypothetical protein
VYSPDLHWSNHNPVSIFQDITDASSIFVLLRDPSAAWYGEVVSDSPTTSPPTVTAQTVPLDPNRNLQETDQTFNDPIFVNVERCTFEVNTTFLFLKRTHLIFCFSRGTSNHFVFVLPHDIGAE